LARRGADRRSGCSQGRLHASAASFPVARRGALADDFRCLVLDCDGVLWRGPEPIRGSAEAVRKLKAAGTRLAFVTNASAKSRADVAARIGGLLGAPIGAEDVVTSGSVAAEEVARHTSTAYVIGEAGLREEMRLAGVTVQEPELPDRFDVAELKAIAKPVGAVVVGHDEQFSYSKLAYAALLLQLGGEDCMFIGTNPDVANRSELGFMVPEAGSLIAALEAASCRKATVVGKPEPRALEQLMQRYALRPGEVLMIGDRLDTDISFGARAGTRTCLVLSGVATREEAERAEGTMRPDFIRETLAEIVGL